MRIFTEDSWDKRGAISAAGIAAETEKQQVHSAQAKQANVEHSRRRLRDGIGHIASMPGILVGARALD